MEGRVSMGVGHELCWAISLALKSLNIKTFT